MESETHDSEIISAEKTTNKRENLFFGIFAGAVAMFLGTWAVQRFLPEDTPKVTANVKYGPVFRIPTQFNQFSIYAGVAEDLELIDQKLEKIRNDVRLLTEPDGNEGVDERKTPADGDQKEQVPSSEEIRHGIFESLYTSSLLEGCSWISSHGLTIPKEKMDGFSEELGGNIQTPQGYWKAEVGNFGERQATSVALKLPYSYLAKLEFPNGEVKVSNVDGVVEIGNLLPLDVVTVTAWTNSEPVVFGDNYVTLVHETGRGEVKMFAQLPAIWEGVASIFEFLVFMGKGVLFVVALAFAVHFIGRVWTKALKR